jgi:hypothetical protein
MDSFCFNGFLDTPLVFLRLRTNWLQILFLTFPVLPGNKPTCAGKREGNICLNGDGSRTAMTYKKYY